MQTLATARKHHTLRHTYTRLFLNHTAYVAAMQPRTTTETEIQNESLIHNCTLKEQSQCGASLVYCHFFKQPITLCTSTYLNILYLCSTNSYITLPSVIDHQPIQLHLRAMYNTYNYMWGPCIITSTLTVPLAISPHFTQS